VPLGEVPAAVIEAALDAANLIGSGLYGVDVKQVRKTCRIIEVNDNPNIDAGNEDAFLGNVLYEEIMSVIKRRIHERVPAMPPHDIAASAAQGAA
jgi:glutathione synthase/RimK-type ligase-like ATP-grasp enzyme